MDLKREAIINGPYSHIDSIIEELADAAYKYNNGQLDKVYSFLSAHNTNIYTLTTALGFIHEEIVPFASSLIFELHLNEKTNKFSIKVLYQGNEIKITNHHIMNYFEKRLAKSVSKEYHSLLFHSLDVKFTEKTMIMIIFGN